MTLGADFALSDGVEDGVVDSPNRGSQLDISLKQKVGGYICQVC